MWTGFEAKYRSVRVKATMNVEELTQEIGFVCERVSGGAGGPIIATYLDSPTPKDRAVGESVTIAGWVISEYPSSEIKIVVRGPVGEEVAPLSVRRPDVLSAFEHTISNRDVMCGFKIIAPLQNILEISALCHGQLYPLFIVSTTRIAINRDSSLNSVLLSRQRLSTENSAHKSYVQHRIFDESTEEFLGLHLEDLFASQNISAAIRHGFVEQEQAHCIECISTLRKPGILNDWLSTAQSSNRISLPSPFEHALARCNTSWLANDKIEHIHCNWLFFTSPTESFIVIQHVTQADAIYFPNRNVLIVFQHYSASIFKRQMKLLASDFDEIFQVKPARSFGSVIASSVRPFHFFNDTIPILTHLIDIGALKRDVKIFGIKGWDYADFAKLYAHHSNTSSLAPEEINKQNAELASFSIKIGCEGSALSGDVLSRSDELVSSMSQRVAGRDVRKLASELSGRFPILWVGFTGQKRRWVEQVEGAAYVINSLARAYPGLAVILDGWTCPEHLREDDLREMALDRQVTSAVISHLGEEIPAYISIGMTPADKIYLAQNIDLFLANYGTGSIYVSRFARKPGVTHINSNFPRFGHIHGPVLEIDQTLIRDIADPTTDRTDYVSYSLAPERVLDAILKILESGICLADRHKKHGLVSQAQMAEPVELPPDVLEDG